MLARIRKQLEENKEQGFTLVELLVVIIIIGILAAIAIPLYLSQQERARDSSAQSDLKNAQIEVATLLVDDPTATSVSIAAAPKSPTTSWAATDIAIGASTDANGGFCIGATAANGAVGDWSIDANGNLVEGALDCTAP